MKNYLLTSALLLIPWLVHGQTSCSQAVSAIEGNNNLTSDTFGNYWYVFTMPRDGKVEVSIPFEGSVRIYVNACGRSALQVDGHGDTSSGALTSGDVVYIRFYVYKGDDYNWQLVVSPAEPGGACPLAVEAVNGTNNLPATSEQSYWYKYTMPKSGRLRITSPASKWVNIYSNACQEMYKHATRQNNATVTIQQGEEVFIQWITRGNGSFAWNLAVVPYEPGDVCQTANPVQVGTNTLSATGPSIYWYQYTMPQSGRVRITSSVSQNINTFLGTCDNLDMRDTEFQNVKPFPVSQGENLFITWYPRQGNENFNWNFAVDPLQDGDQCKIAVQAIVGTNHLPGSSLAQHWYKYTMPSDGTLRVTSSATAMVKLYNRTCDNLNEIERGFKKTSPVTINAGEEVLIKWENRNVKDFDWNLVADFFEAGHTCQTAIAAVLDNNQLPATNNQYVYYHYTTPSRGDIAITSSSLAYVTINSGPCQTLSRKNGGRGNATTRGLPEGTEVLVKWDTRTGGNFDWNLSFDSVRLSQSILFDELLPSSLTESSFSLTAKTNSGLPIAYESSDERVATVLGNIVTIVGAGTTTITASQEGDGTYEAAAPVTQELRVNKANQSITFETLPDIRLEDDSFGLVATASSNLPVHYTSSDESTAIIFGNMVTLTGTGTVFITAQQLGNERYAAAEPVVQSFRVISCQGLTAKVDLLCSNGVEKLFTVLAKGGEAPYQYSLDGTTFQTMADFTALDSGDYSITVRDAHGCTATVETFLQNVGTLQVDGAVGNYDLSTGNGSITLTVSGGQAPYRYAWSQGDTTAIVDHLTLGSYQVIVTDALGCTATATFTIDGLTALYRPLHDKLLIYPNPARTALYIELPTGNSARTAILYNSVGKNLSILRLNPGTNWLDISMLKTGSYLLRFDDGISRRVVVQ